MRGRFSWLAVGTLLTVSSAQAAPDAAEIRLRQLSAAIAVRLPSGAPGLLTRFPWESATPPQPAPHAAPIVERSWRVADRDFLDQVAAMEASAKRAEASIAQHRAARRAQTDRLRQIGQGAEADRMEAEAMAALDDASTQSREALERLRARGRTLLLAVRVNESVWHEFDGGSAERIAGFPAMRRAWSDPQSALSARVHWRVELGPTLLVDLELRSLPETVQADEALARRLLEQVDFAGLRQLLPTL